MQHDATRQSTRTTLDAWWRREPLALETLDGCGHDPDRAQGQLRFEFSSRGDRVEGWLRADANGARPLILLVSGLPTENAEDGTEADSSGAGGSLAAAWSDAWCARSAAVACIDLPLHGTRESAKLSAALRDAASDLDRLRSDPDRKRLVAEFLRQAHWDFRMALDALSTRPEVDATRIACVAVELGALACLHSCEDTRVHAGVFVHAPKGGPPEVDASEALARFRPRPALLVEPAGKTTRAGEPEHIVMRDPAALGEAAWPFLARALGL